MLKIEELDQKLWKHHRIMEICFLFNKRTAWKIVRKLDREKTCSRRWILTGVTQPVKEESLLLPQLLEIRIAMKIAQVTQGMRTKITSVSVEEIISPETEEIIAITALAIIKRPQPTMNRRSQTSFFRLTPKSREKEIGQKIHIISHSSMKKMSPKSPNLVKLHPRSQIQAIIKMEQIPAKVWFQSRLKRNFKQLWAENLKTTNPKKPCLQNHNSRSQWIFVMRPAHFVTIRSLKWERVSTSLRFLILIHPKMKNTKRCRSKFPLHRRISKSKASLNRTRMLFLDTRH